MHMFLASTENCSDALAMNPLLRMRPLSLLFFGAGVRETGWSTNVVVAAASCKLNTHTHIYVYIYYCYYILLYIPHTYIYIYISIYTYTPYRYRSKLYGIRLYKDLGKQTHQSMVTPAQSLIGILLFAFIRLISFKAGNTVVLLYSIYTLLIRISTRIKKGSIHIHTYSIKVREAKQSDGKSIHRSTDSTIRGKT